MKRLCLSLIIIPFMAVFLFGCATTPFIKAVKTGNIAEAELLIKNGADINKKNWRGITPLIEAAIWDKRAMVELFLSKGADALAYDDAGYTALSHAVANGNKKEILDLLIQAQDNEALKRNESPIPAVSSLIRKAAKCMEMPDNYIIRILKSYRPNLWMDTLNKDFVIGIPGPGVAYLEHDVIALVIVHEIALDKLGYIERQSKYAKVQRGAAGAAGISLGGLLLAIAVKSIAAASDATVREEEEPLANKMTAEYADKCFGITAEKRKELIKNIIKRESYKNLRRIHWAWMYYEEKMMQTEKSGSKENTKELMK